MQQGKGNVFFHHADRNPHAIDNDSIDAQAANWFARNRNEHTAHTREQFQAWQANPANAQAYDEFESLWADLGELQALPTPQPVAVKKPLRRASSFALATAAAVLCAVFALNLGTPQTLHQQTVTTLSLMTQLTAILQTYL